LDLRESITGRIRLNDDEPLAPDATKISVPNKAASTTSPTAFCLICAPSSHRPADRAAPARRASDGATTHRGASFFQVPGMTGIERATKHVTAFVHVVFTALFGVGFSVVVALAQRGELIESRERLGGRTLFSAALRDWDAVIDDDCWLYCTNL
jgi:hypothetical protein